MDEELSPVEELEDDDISDDNSTKGGKKPKLPLVNLMNTGRMYQSSRREPIRANNIYISGYNLNKQIYR